MDVLLIVLDYLSVAAFATTGALVGVRRRLDVFGILVLALITGLGGGIIRDVLLGDLPPVALEHPGYLGTAAAAALLVTWRHPVVGRFEYPILLFDAVGLSLFSVASTIKACGAGLDVLTASLLGVIGAVGGGILRDVMSGQVPAIFKGELYATPAFAGALLAAAIFAANLPPPTYVVAAVLCVSVRLLAHHRGWTAPTPGHPHNDA